MQIKISNLVVAFQFFLILIYFLDYENDWVRWAVFLPAFVFLGGCLIVLVTGFILRLLKRESTNRKGGAK
jgi:NhaP-type Na+/H+ or K+/H+ antiporter